jgi:hypothetical protein
MGTARMMIIVAGIAIKTGLCFGQSISYDKNLFYEFSAFGGVGVANQSTVTHGSLHFGADMRTLIPRSPFGILFEIGYAGPTNSLGSGAALFSADYVAPFIVGKRLQLFGAAGYTRLFGTGNAINYGGGISYLTGKNRAIRFEVRNYSSDLKEHNVAFRVGYVLYATSQ